MRNMLIGRMLLLGLAALLACGGVTRAQEREEQARRGGLCVMLGVDTVGSLQFRNRSGQLVHALHTNAAAVEKLRAELQATGSYGPISVQLWTTGYLPYADNSVNTVVVQHGVTPLLESEIERVLVPGGLATVVNGNEESELVRKPIPESTDEWTHFLHDASNNAVSDDSVVGPPKRYQWIAGPKWARSHDHLSTTSAVVSSGGRIFSIIDEAPAASVAFAPQWRLVARDAYNGLLLWKKGIPSWEGHLRGFRSGPTELQRRLVAIGNRVYVTLGYGAPVTALDARTGETVHTYEGTDNALEIIAHDGVLYVVVGDREPEGKDDVAPREKREALWHWWLVYDETPPKKRIVALDAATGATLWTKNDADTIEMMPTTLSAQGDTVYFQSPDEILALDAKLGDIRWRAERPVAKRRPSWSAPTLVIYNDVVISADRAVGDRSNEDPSQRPTPWIVNSVGGIAPIGQMIAFNAKTGERLWETQCKECYNAPVDVLIANGLVWSGILTGRNDPGITRALDPRTGEVKLTRPRDQEQLQLGMAHHRCYRNKATNDYLVLGRDGVEYINTTTGEAVGNHWTRGACQYGIMPCNGLTYAPPHSCACHIETKLDSFCAFAPASDGNPPVDGSPRLEKGPAYGQASGAPPIGIGDWPTYRGDNTRGGYMPASLPTRLQTAWTSDLPGKELTPIVAHGDHLFVACKDTHTVHALNAATGEILWTFTADGPIDSPPTLDGGMAYFGSADGYIYCLRASDGELAWRFRAAPTDRRIIVYGKLESVSPVSGSVLVQDGRVYAAAGRSSFLDDGVRLICLDAQSGELISDTPVEDALNDVLSSDGESIFMRNNRFNFESEPQQENVRHMFSSAGFLDDNWWHRTYWQFGTTMRPTFGTGWGAWAGAGARNPSGRILATDGESVYGFGRFNQYHRMGSHVGLGEMQYLLYGCDAEPTLAKVEPGKPNPNLPNTGRPLPLYGENQRIDPYWATPTDVLVRAMVLGRGALAVAGPPNLFKPSANYGDYPFTIDSQESLDEQAAALAGERGGVLCLYATDGGEKLAQYELDSPPVWDGMAAANGRLYVSTLDGKVICLHGE